MICAPGRYVNDVTGPTGALRGAKSSPFTAIRSRVMSSVGAERVRMVSATPMTRSSYHAGEDFAALRAARADKLAAAER